MTTIVRRPRKGADRLALLQDANYFADELIRCVEELVKIEPSASTKPSWQQAAALTRRIRSLARHEADEQRRRAKQRKGEDG